MKFSDLTDGIVFVALLEKLSGKPCPQKLCKTPKMRIQIVSNATITIDFFRSLGFNLVGFGTEDFVNLNFPILSGFLWDIAFRYQVSAFSKSEDRILLGIHPKDEIIWWINMRLKPYELSIKNCTQSGQFDALSLRCLIHSLWEYIEPLKFKENAKKLDAKTLYRESFEIATDYMKIPQIFNEYQINLMDEKTNLLYLSYFPLWAQKKEAKLMKFGIMISMMKKGHDCAFLWD